MGFVKRTRRRRRQYKAYCLCAMDPFRFWATQFFNQQARAIKRFTEHRAGCPGYHKEAE